MNFPSIHRVVTGHDAQGNAVITSNGPLPVVAQLKAIPGTVFYEVWATTGTPVRVDNGPDPTTGPLTLPPPSHGTRFRFVDIPPDSEELFSRSAEQLRAGFSEIGDMAASTADRGAPHPLMHRTESVDYGVVMEGEITLVLDQGEVQLRAGSVVVQRGTNHAWANRSGKPCRMLFVLVDGTYDPAIGQALAARG
ncbi:cupin domain-containing protein [Variovorax paradoxus]|jgi:mannose-6-phosphate isomerase-like protein (cupin superfamily)|uniref:cupin domain-containing protein n=1 Tax=Variovorax paradoxus TaxID=34073 RepID=UPI00399BEF0A